MAHAAEAQEAPAAQVRQVNVAVLTLTRDRIAYTKHCFASLREFSGCEYDHYVLDQASDDRSYEWLKHNVSLAIGSNQNLGISRGMNTLLDLIDVERYDVIVKFDNDCELTQPDTLRDVCELAVEANAILSPRILGLNNPPPIRGEYQVGTETILDVPQIGGIFLAAPATIYQSFRYSETNPLWGGDDVEVCHWFRREGGTCGYVKRLEAWHYTTTSGQHATYPEYFQRTLLEGKPAL